MVGEALIMALRKHVNGFLVRNIEEEKAAEKKPAKTKVIFIASKMLEVEFRFLEGSSLVCNSIFSNMTWVGMNPVDTPKIDKIFRDIFSTSSSQTQLKLMGIPLWLVQ